VKVTVTCRRVGGGDAVVVGSHRRRVDAVTEALRWVADGGVGDSAVVESKWQWWEQVRKSEYRRVDAEAIEVDGQRGSMRMVRELLAPVRILTP
jgi:hypothetical protein